MRTAILSDIHANLEALQAVCGVAGQHCIDRWICLGDIVGYGADPKACLEQVRRLTDQTLLGNHDAAAVGLVDLDYFNQHARQAAIWTADQLAPSERDYLAALPLTRSFGDALFVHAEPRCPGHWKYVWSRADAMDALNATDARFCFVGHSHHPFACIQDRNQVEMAGIPAEAIAIEKDRRYLINVGSVGQPRDGDSRSCFLIWDDESQTLEFVRVAYDIGAAQRKILAAGLPPALALRLGSGR
jgi:diadenosine tetraphosphatase ApaH/serine/threonine PP2A family protein phosphatase